jgi:hypothetical protein
MPVASPWPHRLPLLSISMDYKHMDYLYPISTYLPLFASVAASRALIFCRLQLHIQIELDPIPAQDLPQAPSKHLCVFLHRPNAQQQIIS